MLNKFPYHVNKASTLKIFIFNNAVVNVVLAPNKYPLLLARDIARAVHHPFAELSTLLMNCDTVRIRKTDYEDTQLAALWRGYDSAPKCLITFQSAQFLVKKLNKFQIKPFKNFLLNKVIPGIYDLKNNLHTNKYNRYAHTYDGHKLVSIYNSYKFAKHIAQEEYRLAGLLKEYLTKYY